MQKLITFALFDWHGKSNLAETVKSLTPYNDKVEVIYHLNNGKSKSDESGFRCLALNDYNKFVKLCATMAQGKYFICLNTPLTFNQTVFESFLEELSKLKSASPIVALTAEKSRTIYAFKTSEIQKLNINWGVVDVNDYLASATLLSCKTFDEVSRQPFEFKCPNNLIYKAENIHNFYKVVTNFIDRFDEIKSKLPPKIYKIAYEELCKQIENYYLCAIYLCKKGKMSSQEIVDFDNELKAKMPFVYFSVEKNMKFDNLKKIRQSGFAKIGFTTSIKLNWYINNN